MRYKMIQRLSLLMVIFSIGIGSALFSTRVLAQPIRDGIQGQQAATATPTKANVTALPAPTATVALNASSSCNYGLLDISVTAPIDFTHEYGIVTTSDGTVVHEFNYPTSLGPSYTGSYGFMFDFPVPAGTIVTLYGYMGQTPPSAANTAEFSVSYRCDTDGVFAKCAGPYGPCAKVPEFPALDGRWFRLNAVAKGSYVDRGNGVIKPHNIKVPLYIGFAWDGVNNHYDVNVYTQTAPGVWAKTWTGSTLPPIFTQSYYADVLLNIRVNNGADSFQTYHTTYIKFVLDKTGVLKGAKYSGSGEVLNGSFNGGATAYYGSVAISGPMVSASTLPFTP